MKNNKEKNTNSKNSKLTKDKIIDYIGWAILILTVISLVILAIFGGVITYNEAVDGSTGVAGIPLSLQMALALFIGTLITMGIVALLVYHFLWEPLNNQLEIRKENIKTNIDAASFKNKEAEKSYQEALLIEKEANKEAKNIIDEGKKEANSQKRNILNESKQQSEKIIIDGRNQIEKEKSQMSEEIRKQIIETSILAAEKIIEKELDQSVNNKMIDELLNELEK